MPSYFGSFIIVVFFVIVSYNMNPVVISNGGYPLDHRCPRTGVGGIHFSDHWRPCESSSHLEAVQLGIDVSERRAVGQVRSHKVCYRLLDGSATRWDTMGHNR